MTAKELSSVLATLRQRYGFSELSFRRGNDQWQVHAAMNPVKDVDIRAAVAEEFAAFAGRQDPTSEFAEHYPVEGARMAGAVRRPRHHIFPQEHRSYFEARGFVGPQDIDRFTVELGEGEHQALHGGGNWRRGRTWEGEWNNAIMTELYYAENAAGRDLEFREVWNIGVRLMRRYGIERNFVPFQR